MVGLDRVSTADKFVEMCKGVMTLPQLPCLMGLEPNLRTLTQAFFCGAQVNI